MATAPDDEDMVKYQFQAEDGEWEAWKNTVPRSKSLEQRVNELIRADTEGRVLAEGADLDGVAQSLERALDELPEDAPGRTAVKDAARQLSGAIDG